MRIAILTNEYPPHVYGGAGVHVEYLTRELAAIEEGRHHVYVICFGDQDIRGGNLTVRGINPNFACPTRTRGTSSSRRRCSGTWSWRGCWTTSTSCTATPGTPTWAGAWPSSSPVRGWC